MLELLKNNMKGKQPDKIPMPFFGFGGRIFLSIYWLFYKTFFFRGKKDYEETIKELDTPLKVQSWMWANLKYISDVHLIDHWQPAERTFERMGGDCEDWAIFSNECLRHKYEGYFLCMYNKSSGHATYVVITDKEKKKKVSVGTFGYMIHRGDWEDIVPNWSGYSDWKSIVVLDEDLKTIKRIRK